MRGSESVDGQTIAVEANWDNRWSAITESFNDVKVFGHGYQPDNVKWQTIHNIPVRVLWELGVFGLLAWLGLIIYGLWKTSWKYAFIAVVAAGLFDHFMWTQLTPFFFALLGVSSWKQGESDKIYG